MKLTDNSTDEDIADVLQEMVFVTNTTVNDALTEKEVDILVDSLETVVNLLVGGNITDDISNVSLLVCSIDTPFIAI